ncbi:MAG: alpha/beta hydrolase [Flavobacteriaceae bacterium]|nr:alpha/beta hydrolase [Flavobacteriaceae bacterium]
MKKIFYILLLIYSTALFFTACSSDDTNIETEIIEEESLTAETILNVSYGENSQQVYDIYLPAGRTSDKTKIIVLVHGGGWTSGDKADMEYFIPTLQLLHPNHAIVNINYVLASTSVPIIHAFPYQFLDVGLVIDQIINQKEDLQVLPEFGLIGTSAGAHISLMYDYVYDTNNVVKMVADIVGPTDFTDPFYSENPLFNILLDVLIDENVYVNNIDLAELTSPAFQVSFSSSPTILFYGNEDPLVPLSNGNLLKYNLSEASITNSYTVYEGGHGNWDEASLLDLQLQLSNFIDTHLPIEE